jgi:hypothetical protein
LTEEQMTGETLPKIVMNWVAMDKRSKGRRRDWHEGIETAMRTGHLQFGQWTNGDEWCLSGVWAPVGGVSSCKPDV